MAGGINPIGNLLGKVDANGALLVSISGGTISPTRILAGDGSASAPSYSFTSTTQSGLFTAGSNSFDGATAGVARWRTDNSGFTIRDTMALLWGSSGLATPDVSLSRGAANRLDLASGDDFYVVSGAIGIGTTPSAASGSLQTSGTISSGSAMNATAAWRLNAGSGVGSATSVNKIIKKVTGIADNTATDVLTVTVPNGNHAATIQLTLLSSNGSTDAFESSRTALGSVVVARTTGVNAVAAAATLTLAQIATVAAGATHTLAYGVSAISGAVGATNTFTVQVTIDDSGNLGSNQCVVLAELVNAEATGVTIA